MDYGGVIAELVSGERINPETNEPISIPHKAIEIEASLDGREAELCRAMHGPRRHYCVVGDEITMQVLGNRVRDRLRAEGERVDELVLERPCGDLDTVKLVSERSKYAEVLIAVGSGSVSDLVKYASFSDGREYSVFPTSPMNAYTTNTASLLDKGIKLSLPAHGATGVFFDLSVLAACPDRLIANAFADIVCRTTAQVDWLISHKLLGTPYYELPYTLMKIEEDPLFDAAAKLNERDFKTLARLVRLCALNGLSTAFVNTTHPGSMAEHMISHYLDMFTGDAHPGSLHGEQVGITTISVLELQNKLLHSDAPPVLQPTPPDMEKLEREFGLGIGAEFFACTSQKTPDESKIAQINADMADNWDGFASSWRKVLLPVQKVLEPMRACKAKTAATELGFATDTYREAVTNARFMRDRYTILDLAAATGELESFIACEMTV